MNHRVISSNDEALRQQAMARALICILASSPRERAKLLRELAAPEFKPVLSDLLRDDARLDELLAREFASMSTG
jgi:hypothetical protein